MSTPQTIHDSLVLIPTYNEKENIENIIRAVFNLPELFDILVIDDLGTEPIYNNVTREYLLALISERLDKNKHFIITTNLTAEEMLSRYNERFISRLSDKNKTKFIPFNGKDLRFNSK